MVISLSGFKMRLELATIENIKAREILDSRGNRTIEVEDLLGRIPKQVPKILDKRLFGGQTEKCPGCKGTGKIYD